MLGQLSDDLGLKMQGVKGISHECGKAYIGQTGHSVALRLQERGIEISHQVVLQGIRGGY
jgi:hypothetical protein